MPGDSEALTKMFYKSIAMTATPIYIYGTQYTYMEPTLLPEDSPYSLAKSGNPQTLYRLMNFFFKMPLEFIIGSIFKKRELENIHYHMALALIITHLNPSIIGSPKHISKGGPRYVIYYSIIGDGSPLYNFCTLYFTGVIKISNFSLRPIPLYIFDHEMIFRYLEIKDNLSFSDVAIRQKMG